MSLEVRASLKKSPGARYINTNTSILIPSISGIIESRRLAMNFSIFYSDSGARYSSSMFQITEPIGGIFTLRHFCATPE